MAYLDVPKRSRDVPRSQQRSYGYGLSNYNKTRQDKYKTNDFDKILGKGKEDLLRKWVQG